MPENLNPLSGGPRPNDPARRAFAITPSDSAVLPYGTRALMVGTAGNVAVVMLDDVSSVVLPSLQPGVVYPIAVKRVLNSGTAASGIIGFL